MFDLIVSPGIRLKDDLSNDQKNITTPEKAIADGASYIVMGRSIRNNLDYVINDLNI
jgi:orotidine-5'-phosphate decarboxylase